MKILKNTICVIFGVLALIFATISPSEMIHSDYLWPWVAIMIISIIIFILCILVIIEKK